MARKIALFLYESSGEARLKIEHPASSIQHPASSIQGQISNRVHSQRKKASFIQNWTFDVRSSKVFCLRACALRNTKASYGSFK
ncbi:MAG TPA: hypothetical protein DCX06_03140 [Opitutae bacterium]|nr:hypothetical protein [Opitutae bacterium]